MARYVYEDSHFTVEIPNHPHNSRKDGGHLILRPKRMIKDRSEMTKAEAYAFIKLTMIVGKAMMNVLPKCGIKLGMINYQDNGNWAIARGKQRHMHLHFYGRAINSKTQKYGEALRFPPQGSAFYKTTEPFDEKDEELLRKEILKLKKKMW